MTINQAKPPTNNLLVRKAIAYGLDRAGGRQRVLRAVARRWRTSSSRRSSSAGRTKVVEVHYNPEKAKALLQQAGMTLPVTLDFWYPTGVSRPYMPDPQRNFEAFSASLEKSGFKIVRAQRAVAARTTSPRSNAGDAGNINLIGWTGDYGDPDNFLGVFFQGDNPQFGFTTATLTALLNKAEQETNMQARIELYQQANEMIMRDILPGVPVCAHACRRSASRRRSTATSPARSAPIRSPRSPSAGK